MNLARTGGGSPRHGLRQLLARLLAGLGLLAANAALGSWWASLLLAGDMASATTAAPRRLPSGPGTSGQTSSSITSIAHALGLATGSASGHGGHGSDTSLGISSLGQVLGVPGIATGTSGHLARTLHADAGLALLAAALAAVVAVAVARQRRPIVTHLAARVAMVCGIVLMVVWPLATVVAANSHGTLATVAGDVRRGGAPVRVALSWCLGGALALWLALRPWPARRQTREARLLASATDNKTPSGPHGGR